MSKAYKCDRCGALYENDDYDENRFGVYNRKGTSLGGAIDLCPACRSHVQAWMKAGENYKKKQKEEGG